MTQNAKKENKGLVNEYSIIMNGFADNPLFSTKWEKVGGRYTQYSAYDDNIVCTSHASLVGDFKAR